MFVGDCSWTISSQIRFRCQMVSNCFDEIFKHVSTRSRLTSKTKPQVPVTRVTLRNWLIDFLYSSDNRRVSFIAPSPREMQ